MAELVFPIAALALTLVVIMPALTVFTRRVLARCRARAGSWTEFGSGSTYAWLVAPTVIPLVWLTSSALHEVEAGAALRSCFIDHSEPTCIDTFLLVALLVVGAIVLLARETMRAHAGDPPTTLGRSHPAAARVRDVVARHPALADLRIQVVRGSAIPVYTTGLLAPRILVDSCFVQRADTSMLLSALLHERAHIAGRDTLRVFLGRLCLSANPWGALLRPDFERWRHAREAWCDGDAVEQGGEPLALAQSIVHAARFDCVDTRGAVAMLCGHDHQAVKLRVMLLMDRPRRTARTAGHLVLLAVVLLSAAAPHVDGLQLLSTFHFEVERLLHGLV